MATIRKSGGVVSYFWQGKLLDPRDDEFAETLSLQRFRTIENAASEEVSVGWVTPADPTGDTFSPEDLDGGLGTWLRFRMDKKAMPMKWLQIHRDAAEKARGKKLSAKERRELKDDLMDQLLPRVLPTITLVDALLFHDRKTVLLFATSKSAKESFTKLFFETFTVPLEVADPLQSGLHAELSDEEKYRLERLSPVRWPNVERKDDMAGAGMPLDAAADDHVGDDEDSSVAIPEIEV
ncbi:MAG: recombination-associated protein RdgC [Planctomycetota bacterium]